MGSRQRFALAALAALFVASCLRRPPRRRRRPRASAEDVPRRSAGRCAYPGVRRRGASEGAPRARQQRPRSQLRRRRRAHQRQDLRGRPRHRPLLVLGHGAEHAEPLDRPHGGALRDRKGSRGEAAQLRSRLRPRRPSLRDLRRPVHICDAAVAAPRKSRFRRRGPAGRAERARRRSPTSSAPAATRPGNRGTAPSRSSATRRRAPKGKSCAAAAPTASGSTPSPIASRARRRCRPPATWPPAPAAAPGSSTANSSAASPATATRAARPSSSRPTSAPKSAPSCGSCHDRGVSVEAVRTPEESLRGLPDFPFESSYHEVDGLRLAYLDEGEGKPVVFFHGEPTWSFLWRKVIPPVRDAGYRCIAPDYAGFGRSDKPTDLDWYTYDRHVELMSALLERARRARRHRRRPRLGRSDRAAARGRAPGPLLAPGDHGDRPLHRPPADERDLAQIPRLRPRATRTCRSASSSRRVARQIPATT